MGRGLIIHGLVGLYLEGMRSMICRPSKRGSSNEISMSLMAWSGAKCRRPALTWEILEGWTPNASAKSEGIGIGRGFMGLYSNALSELSRNFLAIWHKFLVDNW